MKRVLIVLGLLIFLVIVLVAIRLREPSKSHPFVSPTEKPLKQDKKTRLDHIVIITMENKSYDDIVGNKKAPYINTLMQTYSLADYYSAITHPSLPNYLALIGGDTFGIHSDCTNCFINAPNLVDQLEQKNISWKAYMESMPTSCFIGNKSRYAQKHNPFIYFDDIRNNSLRCQKIVPYNTLHTDLSKKETTPNFIWISPDLCSDTHDCPLTTGDDWLRKEISFILSTPAFTEQRSLLVLTWDESETGEFNHIPTIFIGNAAKKQYVSHTPYSHYALLHTIAWVWNLPSVTSTVSHAAVMDEMLSY